MRHVAFDVVGTATAVQYRAVASCASYPAAPDFAAEAATTFVRHVGFGVVGTATAVQWRAVVICASDPAAPDFAAKAATTFVRHIGFDVVGTALAVQYRAAISCNGAQLQSVPQIRLRRISQLKQRLRSCGMLGLML